MNVFNNVVDSHIKKYNTDRGAVDAAPETTSEPVAQEQGETTDTPLTEEANAAIEEARKHKVPSYGGYSIFGSSKKPGQKNLREAKASSITGLVSEGGITKPALLGRI